MYTCVRGRGMFTCGGGGRGGVQAQARHRCCLKGGVNDERRFHNTTPSFDKSMVIEFVCAAAYMYTPKHWSW
jgi:hypothetical protein